MTCLAPAPKLRVSRPGLKPDCVSPWQLAPVGYAISGMNVRRVLLAAFADIWHNSGPYIRV
jgi:hypothetical protein